MNNDFDFVDSTGISWHNYEDYVFNQFGYANYSSSTRDFVVSVLESLYIGDNTNFRYTNCKSELEECFVEYIMSALEHVGISEYGTSPRYSWLTKLGVELLAPMFPNVQRKVQE
jgi:hypothetical protein